MNGAFAPLVATFLSAYSDTPFPHSEELIAGLRAGGIELESARNWNDSSIAPCHHYLRTYEMRANHLKKFPTEHAATLRADTLALCEEMAKEPDALVTPWRFSKPPYSLFVVFAEVNLGRVFGCIKAANNLLVSPEQKVALWGQVSQSPTDFGNM